MAARLDLQGGGTEKISAATRTTKFEDVARKTDGLTLS